MQCAVIALVARMLWCALLSTNSHVFKCYRGVLSPRQLKLCIRMPLQVLRHTSIELVSMPEHKAATVLCT